MKTNIFVYGTLRQQFDTNSLQTREQVSNPTDRVWYFAYGSNMNPAARMQAAEDDEQHEGDQVHEAVPAHGERADRESDRVDVRVNQHGANARAGARAPGTRWE